MHKNTPAENAMPQPMTSDWFPEKRSTPNTNKTAPNGQISEKPTLTSDRDARDQPLAAMTDVIDTASSGL